MSKEKEQPWGHFGSFGDRKASGLSSPFAPDCSDELSAKSSDSHDFETINLNLAYLDLGSDNEDVKLPLKQSFE